MTPISARTERQKNAVLSIVNNPVTFITGQSGTGKSYISLGLAAEHLVREKIDKIVISRPLVTTGRKMGDLPGSVAEKVQPFFQQSHNYLRGFLGSHKYAQYKSERAIQYQPLEYLRGTNLVSTYFILHEAQNATYEQLKMLLTRIGDEQSRVIIEGDLEQKDTKSDDLNEVINKLKDLKIVGNVELDKCFRHPIVQTISKLL